MKVAFYGAGYVGLVQAAVLADVGHEVCCVDVDEYKIEALKKVFTNNYTENFLTFTTDSKVGVFFSELQFIEVGTPPDEDGSADLQYVFKVTETIAKHMNSTKIIIDKSTVPVCTADKLKQKISSELSGREESYEFYVVSNPGFLKEGDAVNDCKRLDRIVIGTDSNYVEAKPRELYAPFNRNHEKIFV